MSKGVKYTIIALIAGACLMILLYFLFGKSEKEYIINFDSNGGSVVSAQSVKEGNSVTKPMDPIKENCTFVRWEYQGAEFDFSQKITSDITLTAIWEADKEEIKYDVTFTVNGKTKTLSISEITDKELEELGFEEKTGYTLNWYVDGKLYDTTTPLEGNITLTGKYEKITTYTVKFNSDGGTQVKSQTLKPNEKVQEPDAITKYGFIFDGWYLNNKKYDFSEAVTKNITLVAKWKEDPDVKRYTVTFDSNGGSSVTKQTVIDGQTASEPKTTWSGYKFVEWQLDNKKYDFKTKVTKDIKLVAKWEKVVEYTVTFNKNNNTSNDTIKVVGGEKVSKPTNPTKNGHTFVEWLLDNQTYDFSKPVTRDITLVARYKENAPVVVVKEYTVTFDSNGGSSVSSQKVKEGDKATVPSNPTRDGHTFVEWRLNGSKYSFDSAVTEDITLVAQWQENPSQPVADEYKITTTQADKLASTDSILKVYKNNQEISFDRIECNGIKISSKLQDGRIVANNDDIASCGATFTVFLNDTNSVKATLK